MEPVDPPTCDWVDEKRCDRRASEVWTCKPDGPYANLMSERKVFCSGHGIHGTLRKGAGYGPTPEMIEESYEVRPLLSEVRP